MVFLAGKLPYMIQPYTVLVDSPTLIKLIKRNRSRKMRRQ
jgi:hypothetical protein